jgi:hypothetical protein
MSSQPECLDCGDSVNHGGIICQDCLTAHDASIARTATLEFIPLAEALASPSVSDARKREIIESLRTTAQQEQHP